ncbi:hypothetical protein ALC56_13214 [Trachymyrmex septentrionalis]|uniref:Uncharacterized protein n=1 Tax=Trachymyrmex septentrionalis TaxID=34720 RepID=A0A195EWT0_9HYME|nr:hypothetical protein ALC56_13214 [Trachymyrmex septentrionalis]
MLQGVSGEVLVFFKDPSQLWKTLSNENCVESAFVGAPLSLTRGLKPLGILTCGLLVDVWTLVSTGLIGCKDFDECTLVGAHAGNSIMQLLGVILGKRLAVRYRDEPRRPIWPAHQSRNPSLQIVIDWHLLRHRKDQPDTRWVCTRKQEDTICRIRQDHIDWISEVTLGVWLALYLFRQRCAFLENGIGSGGRLTNGSQPAFSSPRASFVEHGRERRGKEFVGGAEQTGTGTLNSHVVFKCETPPRNSS